MTRKVPIELHCMRCRMTVSGTIEVDEDGGDEAYLQHVPEGHQQHLKMRCPVCGSAYPREKILDVTLGADPNDSMARFAARMSQLEAERDARKAALKDVSRCPYKVGDELLVYYSPGGHPLSAGDRKMIVRKITPTGALRMSDGNLYKPEWRTANTDEVVYRFHSGTGGFASSGTVKGFYQHQLAPPS